MKRHTFQELKQNETFALYELKSTSLFLSNILSRGPLKQQRSPAQSSDIICERLNPIWELVKRTEK